MTTTTEQAPGALMASETSEQPAVWRRLISASTGDSDIARAAALVRKYKPRFVLFVARGSSDHAALYAGRVDRCTVAGEVVTPQPGGFYGGWITADVVGPFKGGPGSMGW